MVLYELLTIVRPRMAMSEVADVCKKAAYVVLDNGGVVRKIEHMGVRTLPYRMKSHMNYYTQGRYWSMQFDARPAVAAELARVLKIDERIIRSSTFKLEKSMRLGIKREDPITLSGLF